MKHVDAGVDFSNMLLIVRQRFLLDNRGNIRDCLARYPNHSPIPKGIFGPRCQNRHGSLLCLMKIPQMLDGFRPNQRDIAGKHQQIT